MKVLVIDDQPEALKQIERAIASAEGPDGNPFEVVAMSDHEEALSRLDTERFDVVVTDMVMGPSEDEGLSVLRTLAGMSPVTIVLTAYPSIPNCSASMRAGAWTYLEKTPQDGSDPNDALLRTLHEAHEFRLAHPEAGRTNPDSAWVHEHFEEIASAHSGEVVAVLDRKIVDHDESYGRLLDRLAGKFPLARPTIVSIPNLDAKTI